MRTLFAAFLVLLAAATAASAQATPGDPETFEIGLSTDILNVGTNFAGAQLVVFGALDNADQRIQRQGRYDIAVVLEGPRRPVVMRERERFLGIWINRGAERFADVPMSYSLSATRPLRDIAPRETMRQLLLGAPNQAFVPLPEELAARPDETVSAAALIRLKTETGLYVETSGTVEFVSATLFRAAITLPPDLPVGRHAVRAYLFREGAFLRSRTQDLTVRQTGFESQISSFAITNGLVYGLLAVALAFAVGWFGRVLFKRD